MRDSAEHSHLNLVVRQGTQYHEVERDSAIGDMDGGNKRMHVWIQGCDVEYDDRRHCTDHLSIPRTILISHDQTRIADRESRNHIKTA